MNVSMPPKWFHPHGFKLLLGGESGLTHENEILIGSKVVQLLIRPSANKENYQIFWRIVFRTEEFVQGQICMPGSELRDAFCLLQHPSYTGALVEEFKADSGIQGRYIRKNQFLNIPMPGTGMDGDPNISIFISDEIKESVRKLIDSQQ